ncbi:MAG: hypothetical protein NTX96_03055 [Candidatus Zambryskibacteria bacterium]|nr:hypothetical protein [Candidatus Zambryskibacteria bacterium]
MKKNYIILIILVLIALVTGLVIFRPHSGKEKVAEQTLPKDYKNATYIIEGQSVTLTNGLSEIEAAPGSATKIITRYFGNEVKHDLNDDGREDVVFLLTQETGGSGVFYYIVAALNTPDGYIGSQAVFLGDRIAPQTTHMDEGITSKGTNRQNVIVVNYAVRLPGEPFTARPSLGKSMWLKLDPVTMQFAEVAQNFEGESR